MNAFKCWDHGLDTSSTFNSSIHSSISHLSTRYKKISSFYSISRQPKNRVKSRKIRCERERECVCVCELWPMVEDNVDHKSFRNTSFQLGSLRMMVMVVEREISENWTRNGWWNGDGEGKWVVESANYLTAWRGSWRQWLQIKVLGSVDQSPMAWLKAWCGVESDRERFEFRVIWVCVEGRVFLFYFIINLYQAYRRVYKTQV